MNELPEAKGEFQVMVNGAEKEAVNGAHSSVISE